MPTETKSDRLPWLIPLILTGILGAALVGSTLAKSTAQQAKTTPAVTSSPSPSPVSTTVPAAASPSSSPTAQPAVTGLVTLKQSLNGCTPAFDAPNGEQVICFQSGTFKATGEQDGFTALTDGTNKFWIPSASLESVQEKPPEKLLPPQPQANWN